MIKAQPRVPRLFGEDPSRRRLPSSRSSSRGGRRIRRAGSGPRSPGEWRKGCETGVSPGSTATCTPQQFPWSSPRPRPLATMPLATTHGPVRPVRPFVSRSSRGCPDGPGPGTQHPPPVIHAGSTETLFPSWDPPRHRPGSAFQLELHLGRPEGEAVVGRGTPLAERPQVIRGPVSHVRVPAVPGIPGREPAHEAVAEHLTLHSSPG